MSLNGAAVGPVDVKQFLADRKAGNKPPRTASVEVFLEPELAAEYDALVDRYNALVDAAASDPAAELLVSDGSADDAELDALEAQMEDVKARAETSKVTLTFRSYQFGDQRALNAEREAREIAAEDNEGIYALGTAQYSLDPKLSVEDVHALAEAIGWTQYDAVCKTWQELVYGQVDAPKLRRPLRIRATEKP